MGTRRALLDPADVQVGCSKIDLVPAQVHQFGHPQAVPVSHKDHGRVAVAIPVSPDCRQQALDLRFRQILAGAQLAVGEPPRRNCSVYGSWRDPIEVRLRHVSCSLRTNDCSYSSSLRDGASSHGFYGLQRDVTLMDPSAHLGQAGGGLAQKRAKAASSSVFPQWICPTVFGLNCLIGMF